MASEALEKAVSPLSPRVEVLEVKTFVDKRGVSIGRYRKEPRST